jgi:hypothetical protein
MCARIVVPQRFKTQQDFTQRSFPPTAQRRLALILEQLRMPSHANYELSTYQALSGLEYVPFFLSFFLNYCPVHARAPLDPHTDYALKIDGQDN